MTAPRNMPMSSPPMATSVSVASVLPSTKRATHIAGFRCAETNPKMMMGIAKAIPNPKAMNPKPILCPLVFSRWSLATTLRPNSIARNEEQASVPNFSSRE
ncbi:hypothetical protein ATCV1_z301L [Acanthocystis turfacea chlorella virus 1]|uniref:Uncharacterized protein z301L n=1 Tax=Chlorovirus heliozoae TaxID=322019 RepID=A7K8R1_9PHYC|nr:hypothetical protein ATCV1_z301L [Acanthocystis turfacea chlorella virus 1]ABT16435.1 hypothetical protein ATCV1_z301L [Acanthocystis turfacea chlorella virus 1]